MWACSHLGEVEGCDDTAQAVGVRLQAAHERHHQERPGTPQVVVCRQGPGLGQAVWGQEEGLLHTSSYRFNVGENEMRIKSVESDWWLWRQDVQEEEERPHKW